MAKKKTKTPPNDGPVEKSAPATIAGMKLDANNPRRIKPEAAAGLGKSLEEFGDLSGIVWNRRTDSLVCGHQRLARIRARWGDKPIEVIDAASGSHGIRIDASHFFAVRVVDWSQAKQRAANVAANHQAIQGEFTDDVGQYLLSIAEELNQELPGVMDDLLLAGLLGSDIGEEKLTPVKVYDPPKMSWCLIGIETVRWSEIQSCLNQLAEVAGVIMETTSNDGQEN